MMTRSRPGAGGTARGVTPGVTLMRPDGTTPSHARRACETCGGEFFAHVSDVHRGGGRFCSPPCFYRSKPAVTRFWDKVDKNGPVPEARPELGPCWIWTAGLSDKGYGKFGDDRQQAVGAHLWAYKEFVGPVPDGFHLDHLCRVRRCVNFERHLEPVPARVNTMRGEAPNIVLAKLGLCSQGHPLTRRQTGARAGRSECRTCQNAARRKARG